MTDKKRDGMSKKNRQSPFLCGVCKQGFGNQKAIHQHVNAAHAGKLVKVYSIFKEYDLREDGDESFADRAIQAGLDHAMGVDNPDYDWLVEPYERERDG